MKKVFLSALVAGTLVFTACENGPKDATEAQMSDAKQVEQPDAASESFPIDMDASKFQWEGHKKVKIGDAHKGTVRLQSGEVKISGNRVVGGSFVMDMNSIENLDLKGNDEKQTKLIGHLKSPDFFDVQQFPTSTFMITSVKDSAMGDNNAWIEGNLTIKNNAQNIGFPAKIEVKDDKATAKARVIIDRSKFDVRYGSENFFKDLVADDIISNDITLDIDLVAKKGDGTAATHDHSEEGHTH